MGKNCYPAISGWTPIFSPKRSALVGNSYSNEFSGVYILDLSLMPQLVF